MFAEIRAPSNQYGSLRSIEFQFALHSIRVLNNNTNAPTIRGFHLRMTFGACADA
jgi:hypothetical protein